jgi:A/G-specific adenine glycosylase
MRAMTAIPALRRRLVGWYRRARRDLPWRRTRDPYAIWIAEVMLQQTRVDTVIPYYERFLARFPDAPALAEAPLDAVLAAWSGLGYYARARNLHAAARVVAREHGGLLPREVSALQALPGIGRYTAGAIASIAFGERAPVLDGNVARVLARLFAVEGDPRSPAVARRLWDLASAMVAAGEPGEVNQALMELGALVCAPEAPDCHLCPLAPCRARARGEPERFPERPPRRTVPEVHGVAALCAERGRVLLVRRPPGGLLGGLWELPGGERRRGEEPARALARALRERLGAAVAVGERAGSVKHVFTHRRLELTIYRCRLRGRPARGGREPWGFFAPAEIPGLPRSRLTERALRAAGVALEVAAR